MFAAKHSWHADCVRSWPKEVPTVLWTIVLVLLILWLLGVVALPTVGGLIHLLLVLALIVLLVQLISGRRVVV
jgi:hypothetical protein